MFFWLILFIVFLLIEIFTATLVSIWFSLSSLVVFMLSFYIKDYILQSVIFFICSLVSIFVFYKFFKKLNTNNEIESRVIGQTVILQREGSNFFVKIDGKIWNVEATDEYIEGKKYNIIQIQGNKLLLLKAKIGE